MPNTILFEVTPYDPSTSSFVTVRMSGRNGDASSVQLNGYEWLPNISGAPKRKVTLFNNGSLQPITISHGNVEFLIHPDFSNTAWSNYMWDGALGRIWVGAVGATFASYTQIFEGSVGPLVREEGTATVALYGPESILNTNLLVSTYNGSGGINGDSTVKGQLKPVCYGDASNIPLKLIDPQYRVFQIHDGQINDVLKCYENALDKGPCVATVTTTYAALIALTLQPAEWAKCPALGLVRMGGTESGVLTADVQGALDGGTYVNTIATIVPAMMKTAGVLTAKIDQTSFNSFGTTTNMLLRSQELENTSAWATGLGATYTVVVNAALGPDGTSTLEKIVEAADLNPHGVRQQVTLTANAPYRLSWYARAAERTRISAWSFGAVTTNSSLSAIFDLSANTATGSNNPILENLSGGLFRCSCDVVANATGGAATIHVGPQDATVSQSYTGTATNGVYIGCVQLEVGTVVTPYIATTTAVASNNYVWSYYNDSQAMVGEVVRDALLQAGGYLLPTSTGGWKVGNFFKTSTPTPLDQLRSTTPLVNTVKTVQSPPPAYRLKLGGNRSWRVHSINEVSPAIYNNAVSIATANAAAAAAQTAANQASSDAAAANALLTAIVSDTVLDRSEKAQIIREYGRITAEKAGIDSTGNALGLTSDVTAYDNSYNTLTTYLNGLSPAYTDTTQNTTIVAATFTQKFNDYYAARQSLLNKTAQLATISAYLTNESISVPANSSGTVSSYANANGSFVVMQGNTNVSEQCTFAQVGIVGTGLTYTLSNTAGSRGQYIITGGWTENTPATITLSATFGAVSFTKTITISKGIAGATGSTGATGAAGTVATVGFLTNEAHTVQTASDGSGGSLAAAGGTLRVFAGSTEVTGAAVTYSVPAYTAGLTISVATTGVYSVTGLTVDFATATLRAVYGTATIDLVYSIAKSKAGATGATGANAKLMYIIADRQTISYDASGTLTPALQQINFTAFKQNTSGTVTWAVTDIAGNAVSSSYLSATSGDTIFMTAANFSTARSGTSGVIVTGTIAADGLSDKISVASVQTGATGNTGSTGATGAAGRDALVYYSVSTASPGTPVVGDTWYQTDTKKWFRWNGTTWVQLLGNISQYDQIDATAISAGVIAAGAIGANQLAANSITAVKIAAGQVDATKLSVSSLDAVSATIGLLRTANTGARVEIGSNVITVYDASNVLRVRLGLW